MAAVSFDRDRHIGVHAASRKIGKQQEQRKPVIIYMVSPKVIHVEADEFMSLVQRLTGPDKERASTSTGAASTAPAPRVKASRALNQPGPAVSVSMTAVKQGVPSSWSAGPSPSPTTGFLFHDLSPLRGGALKGEGGAPMVSPSWMHHVVGDHFLSPGGAPSSTLGSPSAAFLDIFGGPLSSQQHQ